MTKKPKLQKEKAATGRAEKGKGEGMDLEEEEEIEEYDDGEKRFLIKIPTIRRKQL